MEQDREYIHISTSSEMNNKEVGKIFLVLMTKFSLIFHE